MLTTTNSMANFKERDNVNSGYKITRKAYKNASETSSTKKKFHAESI